MSKFYYHLKATNSENVGELSAETEKDALQHLNDVYAPKDPVTGKAHKGIEIKLITEKQYKDDDARIAKERKAQAESQTWMVTYQRSQS